MGSLRVVISVQHFGGLSASKGHAWRRKMEKKGLAGGMVEGSEWDSHGNGNDNGRKVPYWQGGEGPGGNGRGAEPTKEFCLPSEYLSRYGVVSHQPAAETDWGAPGRTWPTNEDDVLACLCMCGGGREEKVSGSEARGPLPVLRQVLVCRGPRVERKKGSDGMSRLFVRPILPGRDGGLDFGIGARSKRLHGPARTCKAKWVKWAGGFPACDCRQ